MSLVEKPAEVVGSLVLRLLTIRYRRRRELFAEILQPLFAEFENIHAHYIKLHEQYEKLLPYRRDDSGDAIKWIMSEGGDVRSLTHAEEQTALSKVIAEAKLSSELTSPIRKLFRTRIADLLRRVNNESERRYLLSLLAYFGSAIHTDINWWHFENRSGVSATIDRLLSDKVKAKALIEVLEVTSIGESIEDLLIETTEYEYPRKYILASRQWIEEAYVQVGREFQRMKYDVISEAPI